MFRVSNIASWAKKGIQNGQDFAEHFRSQILKIRQTEPKLWPKKLKLTSPWEGCFKNILDFAVSLILVIAPSLEFGKQ